MKNKKQICIIGDGGWGTTIAIHLSKKNFDVSLWGPFPKYLLKISKTRINSKFLPGIKIPENIKICDSLTKAISNADVIVFAIPSKFAVSVLKQIKNVGAKLNNKIFINVTKGFDTKNLLRISEIIKKELGNIPFCVLSGPNIAREVVAGIPSSAVIASNKISIAKQAQQIFNSPAFRVYTNNDVVGVELGGSIKNIIAIACGICDGVGFGSNTKAAILTRGLAEMARLGKALGAKTQTFSGLSGLGDLITTCFSAHSRNRFVGEQLGKKKSLKDIISSMEMVAEGVETVKAVYKLSKKHNVSMPITNEIYNIIYKNKKPSEAVSSLMSRKMKSE